MSAVARAIALYLPQFHPIPENDDWWGRGFTEWTNTAKAKPLFKGHYQPHVPADLGFYDLRVPETREAQAELAREYGIEAFCYYHYWFGGKRILERPFEEILESGKPDFPFCLCWANETWTGVWHGLEDKTLIEQTYPGDEDYRRHFQHLLKAFRDPRYVTIEGKPLFMVYRPENLPDARHFTDYWRQLAEEAGLPGLYLICEARDPDWDPHILGFDGVTLSRLPPRRQAMQNWTPWTKPLRKLRYCWADRRKLPTIHQYEHVLDHMIADPVEGIESYPYIVPNWDNTPRSGSRGMVIQGSTPDLFRKHVRMAIQRVKKNPPEKRIIFVKSWNEWAEGNHLEPDLRYGHAYLQVIKEELEGTSNNS